MKNWKDQIPMKFDDALNRFKRELCAEYGPCASAGIVKIGLTPELFEVVMREIHSCVTDSNGYRTHHVNFSDLGEVFIEDVQLVQREREKF